MVVAAGAGAGALVAKLDGRTSRGMGGGDLAGEAPVPAADALIGAGAWAGTAGGGGDSAARGESTGLGHGRCVGAEGRGER